MLTEMILTIYAPDNQTKQDTKANYLGANPLLTNTSCQAVKRGTRNKQD